MVDQYYNSSTMCVSTASFYEYANTIGYPCSNHNNMGLFPQERPRKPDKKSIKKRWKAEAKAYQLMVELIGDEQGEVYKKTKRIITRPSKYFWMIGSIFSDIMHDPFQATPEVVRIDDEKKLYYTRFCVIQDGGGKTPFTDKVISFATNLTMNEKTFKATINRIHEGKLNKIDECALWEFE